MSVKKNPNPIVTMKADDCSGYDYPITAQRDTKTPSARKPGVKFYGAASVSNGRVDDFDFCTWISDDSIIEGLSKLGFVISRSAEPKDPDQPSPAEQEIVEAVKSAAPEPIVTPTDDSSGDAEVLAPEEIRSRPVPTDDAVDDKDEYIEDDEEEADAR